jgi:hypothetical protein
VEKFIHRENAVTAEVMNRKGVEFTLLLIEPGLWKWRFQIGQTVTTGVTKTNLKGVPSGMRLEFGVAHSPVT